MTFLKDLRDFLRGEEATNIRASEISPENPLFVYVRIPGDLDPEDREELFSDPLRAALEKDNLGAVTGGGSCFMAPDEEGDSEVEFCGIDVDLNDAARGLELLRRELIRLNAPQGTALLYEVDGDEYEEPIYRAAI